MTPEGREFLLALQDLGPMMRAIVTVAKSDKSMRATDLILDARRRLSLMSELAQLSPEEALPWEETNRRMVSRRGSNPT